MKLITSSIIIAVYTLLSRISGLLRELFIASQFGSGPLADVVNVAFKLPNLFRKIFGEGALSLTFVPLFTNKMQDSAKEAKKFTGTILMLLILCLSIIVVFMEIFMPYCMHVIAPGFTKDPQKFTLVVFLSRLTIPYLVLISIAALFGAVLNSVQKFAAFAFVQIILNLSIIFIPFICKNLAIEISVSIAVCIGGILQVLFMYFALKKAKILFILNFDIFDNSVKKFLKNFSSAICSSGIQQLNFFISQSIASFIPGAIAILSYADRVYQFPLSIIGVTFATILLPELSKAYKKNDFKYAKEVQNYAIKFCLFLALPAAFGIITLSHPIIHVLYERGLFTAQDTVKTSYTMTIFALGLPAFVLSKIFIPNFYARHDVKTPLIITIYTLIINTVLNIILMIYLDYIGIAIGSVIASWFNAYLSYKYCKKGNDLIEASDNTMFQIEQYNEGGAKCIDNTRALTEEVMFKNGTWYNFDYSALLKFVLGVLWSCIYMSVMLILIRQYIWQYMWNDFYSFGIGSKFLILMITILLGILTFAMSAFYFKLPQTLRDSYPQKNK